MGVEIVKEGPLFHRDQHTTGTMRG
jgi:hypothetical protein